MLTSLTGLTLSSFGLYNILTRLGVMADIPEVEALVQSLPL